jgi:hypothetical protein
LHQTLSAAANSRCNIDRAIGKTVRLRASLCASRLQNALFFDAIGASSAFLGDFVMLKTRGEYDAVLTMLSRDVESRALFVDNQNNQVEIVHLGEQLYISEMIIVGNGAQKWWKPIERNMLLADVAPMAQHAIIGSRDADQWAHNGHKSLQSWQQPPAIAISCNEMWPDAAVDALRLPSTDTPRADTPKSTPNTHRQERGFLEPQPKRAEQAAGLDAEALKSKQKSKAHQIEVDKLACLLQTGCTEANIAQAGLAQNATQALQEMCEIGAKLLDAGYSRIPVARILTQMGGIYTASALLKHGPQLLQTGFTRAELSSIARNHGGGQALAALLEHRPHLQAAGFTLAEIRGIASQSGGAQALQAFRTYAPQLEAVGFRRQDLVKVASHHGAAQTLPALLANAAPLVALGFSLENLLVIANKYGGAQSLKKLLKYEAQLRAEGFSRRDIVKIASRRGAADSLETLLTYRRFLLSAGFTQNMIIKIADSRVAAKKIQTLARYQAQLQQRGHTPDAITRVVSASDMTLKDFTAWVLVRLD